MNKLQQSQVGLGKEQPLPFGDYATKVFAGLRALHVVSNTGAGKAIVAGRHSAVRVAQLADKHIKLFPPANQKEFLRWCKTSKVGREESWSRYCMCQHASKTRSLIAKFKSLQSMIPPP